MKRKEKRKILQKNQDYGPEKHVVGIWPGLQLDHKPETHESAAKASRQRKAARKARHAFQQARRPAARQVFLGLVAQPRPFVFKFPLNPL